jgi:predicted RecA/RadA family phage recombinase
MTDFYTYRGEVRGGVAAGGSPIPYKYTEPAAGAIAQGEMVGWDATNKILARWVRTGGALQFVGVTKDSALAIQKLGNQTALTPTELAVFTTGIHQFLGTAGDTYKHGDAIYMAPGADNTKVTNTNSGGPTRIGTCWLPDGTTLSGAVLVPVLIDEYTITQV